MTWWNGSSRGNTWSKSSRSRKLIRGSCCAPREGWDSALCRTSPTIIECHLAIPAPGWKHWSKWGSSSGGKSKDGRREVFIDPEACTPRSISAQSLVSPFDPLIWYRQRLARLFDFDYRLEIFVPAGKRRWGYYVPPQPYGRTGLVVQPASSCRPNKMLRPISVSRVVEDAGYRLPPLSLTSTRKTRSQLARYFGIARLVLSAALANGVSMSSPVSSTALCQIPAGDLYQYQ